MDDKGQLVLGEHVKITLISVIGSLALGLLLGFLAKLLDNVPVVGEIGTYLGFWILVASLIVAVSRSPQQAALNVLVFFLAMLAAYYLYSTRLFGFFPRRLFMTWGGLSLVAPFGAYILWYARQDGWFAALSAALPISLLFLEGHSFFYTYRPAQGFDILAALALVFVLCKDAKQRLRSGLIAVGLFILLREINIFSLVFGGL